MVNTLANVAGSRWYWLALMVLGASFEATALYFQYGLDYGPCILCIHVRILVAGLLLVALLGLAVARRPAGRIAVHVCTVVLVAGMIQRAYLLLGIERGFVEGSCSADLGLPAWLPLDRWLPVVFQIQEPCGYTPPMPLGFTMAEVLFVLSSGLLVLSTVLLLATLFASRAPGERVA